MATGTVKSYDPNQESGYVTTDDTDQDLVITRQTVQSSDFFVLQKGQHIQFEIVTGPDGEEMATFIGTVD
jgi:cold shock CspA family protein